MAFKFIVFSAFVAAANAGFIGAPAAVSYAAPTLVSQDSNILRTPGNLGQVSTYAKTISTPYSSVTKYDTRVSNDALAYPAVAHTYAAPAIAHGYAAPAISHGYAAPAISHGYAAPAISHGYAGPAIAPGYATHGYAAAPAGLLGVAYSAAPAVAHLSYSNGYGINYAY